MVNVVGLIIVVFIVVIFGGGIAYFLWVKTRPKKECWQARVYQLGEGIRPPQLDERGAIISDLKLQDLRPYAKDVLEKIEKAKGLTIFRLSKLNKVTPAVENDCVEYWGEGNKEISVLLQKDGCTLLKKGYDKVTGEAVFSPLSHSRINLIKGEMSIRKDRLQKEKDILQAITPWIVAGISIIGLVSICYIMIQGFITISDRQAEIMVSIDTQVNDLLEIDKIRYGITVPEPHNVGAQPTNNPQGIIIPP